jgi:hypothetical protein
MSAYKLLFDIGKKYLPNATKAAREVFKKKVADFQTHMSHESAISLALKESRDIKSVTVKKNTGGIMNNKDYYKDIL